MDEKLAIALIALVSGVLTSLGSAVYNVGGATALALRRAKQEIELIDGLDPGPLRDALYSNFELRLLEHLGRLKQRETPQDILAPLSWPTRFALVGASALGFVGAFSTLDWLTLGLFAPYIYLALSAGQLAAFGWRRRRLRVSGRRVEIARRLLESAGSQPEKSESGSLEA